MLAEGSPEHIAFLKACQIDKCKLIDAVEEAGLPPGSGRGDGHFVGKELVDLAGTLTERERTWVAGRYPAELLAAWFDSAGYQGVDTDVLELTTAMTCERYLQELRAEGGSVQLPLRGKNDLRTTIKQIGKAERTLARLLGKLRDEATRSGHASTDRGERVRHLYHRTQRVLLSALSTRGRLSPRCAQDLANLQTTIDVEGSAYFGGPLPLEWALLDASDAMDKLSGDDQYWDMLPNGQTFHFRARKRWVLDMMKAWRDATNSVASFTDVPKRSAFYIWLCCAHGHLVGLLREPGAATRSNVEAAMQRARRHGLLPIPTARTLLSDLKAIENERRDK